MNTELMRVITHLGRGTLGGDPKYLDQSAGRTVLFHGGGRICKVFLPNGDASERAEREFAALTILADTDIPVPAVLDRGTFPNGDPWILMTELPGIPATVPDFDGPEGPRFLRLQGQQAVRIHAAVRPIAFGVWTTEPRPSLTDWATRCSDGLAQRAATARPERAELCGRLRRTQESWLPWLRDAHPVLVHGDLTPGNFLLRSSGPDGSVLGLIDWETAEASTPAAEFSRPALFGGAGLTAFIDGYGPAAEVPAEQVGYFVADRVLQIFGTTGGRWNPRVDLIAELMADRLLAGDLPWPGDG